MTWLLRQALPVSLSLQLLGMCLFSMSWVASCEAAGGLSSIMPQTLRVCTQAPLCQLQALHLREAFCE